MSADYLQEYKELSDDELLQLVAERSTLVEDANIALDIELRNRGITPGDLAKYQQALHRYELREKRNRRRRLFGRRQYGDSWVRTAGVLFCAVLANALISIAYLALPAPYHFPPDWQEAFIYVMFGSTAVVVASGRWLRKVTFWISLIVSSLAHALSAHYWIVHTKPNRQGDRDPGSLPVLLGPVLFLVTYACAAYLRRKFQVDTRPDQPRSEP